MCSPVTRRFRWLKVQNRSVSFILNMLLLVVLSPARGKQAREFFEEIYPAKLNREKFLSSFGTGSW